MELYFSYGDSKSDMQDDIISTAHIQTLLNNSSVSLQQYKQNDT